jgi:hypothetical protein
MSLPTTFSSSRGRPGFKDDPARNKKAVAASPAPRLLKDFLFLG